MGSVTSETQRADLITKAIQAAVREEAKRIVQEEAEKASKEVERRLNEVSDSIALKVLSHYEIIYDGHRVAIEVKKLAPQQPGGAS